MKQVIILIMFCAIIQAQAQDVKDSITFEALLGMDIEQLLNTKVSIAAKTEQELTNAPSVVSVITASEIKNMGAREIYDVLQLVPGFELSKNATGNIMFGVRGVKDPRFSCKILLLVDGSPVNQVYYGSSISFGYEFDMDNIEYIEIIRGTGSAIYGRNAFSAVINVVTKSGVKTEKGIVAKAELGTFNTYAGRLSYGFDKNNLNFHLSTYFIKTDATDALYPNTQDRWVVNQNNQIINAHVQYKGLRIGGSFLNQDMGNWKIYGGQINKSGNYNIEYQKALNEKLNIKTLLYGQNGNYIQEGYAVKPNTSMPYGMIFRPEFKEYLYGGELEASIKLFDRNDLSVGMQCDVRGVKDAYIYTNFSFSDGSIYQNIDDYNLIKWEPGFVKDNGHNYYNYAVYLQDIWYPYKRFGVTIGARYDYENQIGGVFNPRLGIVWNIARKTYFKLLYGSAYRSPSPNQQYATLGFSLGDENLKPERINTYEAVITFLFKKMSTQINVYHNQISDMIYAEKFFTQNLTQTPIYRNMSKNIATGVEFENKLFLTDNFYTFINYSYTKSENTDKLEDESELIYNHVDVAPHKLNAGFNLVFLKYLNLNMNMMYRSKMKKFFRYDASTLSYTDVSQDPVGNYAVVNATLRMVGLVKGLEMNTSVYNILNTKYYSQEPFVANVPEQANRQFIVRAIYKY